MPEVPPSEHAPGPDETAEAASPGLVPNDLSQLGMVSPPRAPFGQPTPEQADVAPDGPPAPVTPGPAVESAPLSTTGVPHFPPPAAVPEFPRAPGLEGPTAGGASDAIGAAPPARRWSVVRPFARGLREVAETIILALLIFLLVRSVVQNFQVEGRSMEPTLETSWYLLVNKALYWEINLNTLSKFVPLIDPGDDPTRYVFRGPHRGDVIVFKAPSQPERDFIKRIIAVPGETVEVRDCTVFIDGEPLDEPYITDRPRYTFGPETVPPDNFFVLGDNRNNSSDSHSWGMLPKENIIGQAWLTYWPFSSFGLVDNTSVAPGDGIAQQAAIASGAKPASACSQS